MKMNRPSQNSSGIGSAFALLLGTAMTAPASVHADAAISYNKQIRPIINTACIGCHGGVKKSAGVSFIFREEALGMSANGNRVIIPGDPENSEFIKRITSTDPRYVMPPASGDHAHDPLKQEEIDLIKKWIRQGAEWEEHWAYIPPVKREPAVQDGSWVREPMDGYVLERLEGKGLRPSLEAPRAQWLRRVTFDLTGLPPTPEARQAFLDDTAADAYEKVVDRLLASPRYGERWASMWMDLARYADTVGYEKDLVREMWPYRDWLIQAFNKDLPYPEFVRDQLAGDLVEHPTTDQLMATSFLRLTPTNTEGGTDDEEFRVAAVIDRINTSWVAFQGLSFSCVQCHGHPYEPIPHEDYYNFMDLINNTEDCDLDNDFPRHLLAHDPEKRQLATDTQLKLLQLREERNEPGSREMRKTEQWIQPSYTDLKTSSGSLHQEEGILYTGGTQAAYTNYSVTLVLPEMDGPVTALKCIILPDSDRPEDAPFRGAVLSQLHLQKIGKDGSATPLPIEYVYADSLSGPYDPNGAIAKNVDGVGGYPKLFKKRESVFVLKDPVQFETGDRVFALLESKGTTTGAQNVALRRFQLQLTDSEAWPQLLDSKAHAQITAELKKLNATLKPIKGDSYPVARERPAYAARETRMFIGGNWLNKGEVHQAGVPEVLNPYAAPASNRLEMAAWLTHPENSLASRVFVNRLFAELFGYGIVPTLGDFGSSGLPPSNQPLLDYLAVAFQEDYQWRMKPLLREMVLSATYRQEHASTPELSALDPQNRLLARGPRTRLSGEMMRDNALAVSGLIAHRDGGPSVMPPQPDGVWNSPYSNKKWVTAEGADRYRRALYTFWSRSAPYPSLITFDVPTRDLCNIQRIPTNTPLQSLVTLNDPVYLECAQHLAKIIQDAPETDLREKLAEAHLLTTQQAPSEDTLNILVAAYHQLKDTYQEEAPPGMDSVTTEEAVYMNLASILLNIDSALTK